LEKLEPLSPEEKRLLDQLSSPARTVGVQETIIHQGERVEYSTLLLEGFAYRYRLLSEGRRQILSFQIPGDFIDLHSFLLKTMDHAVSTLTACKLVFVPHSTLRHITENYPRLTRALWCDVAADGAMFREWMVGIGRRSAQARIAHIICETLYRLRAVGLAGRNKYSLPVRQSELADAVGLSPVHVNRVLQDFRRAGILESGRGQLVVRDLVRLCEIGDFEPTYLH